MKPNTKKILRVVILCSLMGLITSNHYDLLAQQSTGPITLKALIIDGQNNHGIWPKTTMMLKDYLVATGLFKVDITRTAYTWQGSAYTQTAEFSEITDLLSLYPLSTQKETMITSEPKADPTFMPKFSDYDVIISNFGWRASDWPANTKADFEAYMEAGGGLVVVHAADNPWGNWPAFNEMIGLGGWGGRNTSSGPYVYYSNQGTLEYDVSEGICGSHGPEYEFVVETRAPEHPIMKGLPQHWLHAKDELYDRLRGPAQNMTILATAFSDEEGNLPSWDPGTKGTGRHEPVMMTVDYKKGRVFHTILGHMDYSMECVGFITTLQRGAEWAATGKVTIPIPQDFPNASKSVSRHWISDDSK